MPVNIATGDNVKTQMPTPILTVRQRHGPLGSSEILVLASPFGAMGRVRPFMPWSAAATSASLMPPLLIAWSTRLREAPDLDERLGPTTMG